MFAVRSSLLATYVRPYSRSPEVFSTGNNPDPNLAAGCTGKHSPLGTVLTALRAESEYYQCAAEDCRPATYGRWEEDNPGSMGRELSGGGLRLLHDGH